ncbi:MAG: hypothetical protein WC340_08825 [Kiritimatiellia bacterium]
MVVPTTIAAIKAITDFTKLVIASKADAMVKEKAVELTDSIIFLQSLILDTQSQNHELLNANREIREKLMNLLDWKDTAVRYELAELCPGVFVYAIKKAYQDTEPFHHICPNCYENKKRSILTQSRMTFSGTQYTCNEPTCKTQYNDYSRKLDTPRSSDECILI